MLGIDVSQVALDRAAARARETGLDARTTWEHRDLLAWTPPAAAYDLVTVAFVHLACGDQRREVYAGSPAAVAPGGTFLVAAHHPDDLGVVPRPPHPELFFTAEELAADLRSGPGSWEVVTAEARPRPGHHPRRPPGHPARHGAARPTSRRRGGHREVMPSPTVSLPVSGHGPIRPHLRRVRPGVATFPESGGSPRGRPMPRWPTRFSPTAGASSTRELRTTPTLTADRATFMQSAFAPSDARLAARLRSAPGRRGPRRLDGDAGGARLARPVLRHRASLRRRRPGQSVPTGPTTG